MDILLPIIPVVFLHILAMVSPGPNFLISARQGLTHPRRAQIATAAGLALGVFVFTVSGFLGLSAIIVQSVVVYNTIKYLGALYLVYLGIKSLVSSKGALTFEKVAAEPLDHQWSTVQSYRVGLFTMLLNPKAIAFFLALFTTVLSGTTPMASKLLLMVILPSLTFSWFTLVARFFSFDSFQHYFFRYQRKVNLTFGGLLIMLGLRIAFSGKS